MTADLFPTVYTAYPRKCAMARCRLANWRVTSDYAFRSAEEAWQHEVDVARACRRPRPDPADYVVVSGALTNDTNEHGDHLVIADWQHTYDPQGFYEEIERERREAEMEAERSTKAHVDRPTTLDEEVQGLIARAAHLLTGLHGTLALAQLVVDRMRDLDEQGLLADDDTDDALAEVVAQLEQLVERDDM